MNHELETLTDRVAKLERRCRRWQTGVAFLSLALAGVGILGATRPRGDDQVKDFRGTLTARRFEVVDDDGKLLGRFGMGPVVIPGSKAELHILHNNGHEAIGLFQSGDSPNLMMYPAEGNAKVITGIDRGGNGFLKLMDKDGKEIKSK
jgi:hypothetical protein